MQATFINIKPLFTHINFNNFFHFRATLDLKNIEK